MTLELAILRAARPEIDPSRAALAQRLERVERLVRGAGAETAAEPPREDPDPAAAATNPAPTAVATAGGGLRADHRPLAGGAGPGP